METLAHQFLLFELDPQTGLSGISNLGLRWYALAGAILAELQLQDRLVASSADRFVFVGEELMEGALGRAETLLLRTRKPRTLEQLMRQLYQRSFRVRREFLSELLHSGALDAQPDRILPWRTRWIPSESTRDAQVDWLRGWLATSSPAAAPDRADLLLSLLRATGLLGRAWTGLELVHLRPEIEARTARAPIGKLVLDMAQIGHDSTRPFSFL